ncbi:MAG: hypothetical protein B6D61_03795 [Bacteroidetes bacterium 4484_249]|nr:MAG: hypothetical protein B6D61_03795 [Bacteroidetes bacterium 4484_249]
MEEQIKKQLPLFTKISLIVNILLFGITGIVYLVNGNNIIGIILLCAGLTNIFWALFSFNTKNIYFAILNFLFATVALIVGVDYQFAENKYMAIVWIAIMLVYLIVGFVVVIKLKKQKTI